MTGPRLQQPGGAPLGPLGQHADLRHAARERRREVLPAQAVLELRLAGGVPQPEQGVEVARDGGEPSWAAARSATSVSAVTTSLPAARRIAVISSASSCPPVAARVRSRSAAAPASASSAARTCSAVTAGAATWAGSGWSHEPQTGHGLPVDERRRRARPPSRRCGPRRGPAGRRPPPGAGRSPRCRGERCGRALLQHRDGPRGLPHALGRGELLGGGRQQVPGRPGGRHPAVEFGDPGRQSGQPLLDVDRGDLVAVVPLPGPGQRGQIAFLLGGFGDQSVSAPASSRSAPAAACTVDRVVGQQAELQPVGTANRRREVSQRSVRRRRIPVRRRPARPGPTSPPSPR